MNVERSSSEKNKQMKSKPFPKVVHCFVVLFVARTLLVIEEGDLFPDETGQLIQ